MSNFEKTVRLLTSMPESNINIIYNVAQSLNLGGERPPSLHQILKVCY